MKNTNASFNWDSLNFAGGAPSLHLLLGAEETLWSWCGTHQEPASRQRRLTPLGEGEESHFRWEILGKYRVEWRITELSHFKGFSIRTIFTNIAQEPVRLRRLGIIESSCTALTVEPGDWFLSSAIGGWENPPSGLLARANPVSHFHDFASIYSNRGERGVFIAAVGPAESDVGIDVSKSGDAYGLSIFSEMTDILVESGESRTSEEVVFLFAPYQVAAESAMRWIGATHGSRLHRGAFTGWCSWYEQYNNITASHVIQVAGAVKKHKHVIPQKVIQIDEGYEKAWGDWQLNPRFPDGWAPVTEAIRSAGATPGVWIAPLGVYDSLNLHREHPEWFQFLAGVCEPFGMEFLGNPHLFLDPTHPDVQQFIREIVRARMADGFRYYKIDFNKVAPCRFFNSKLTRFQAYRNLYRLYREEVGEESYLNSCCARLDRAVVGLVDAMRIGADSDYEPSWILMAIRGTSETSPANGILTVADPDVFFMLPREKDASFRHWQSTVSKSLLDSWQGFVGLLGGLVMTSEPLCDSAYEAAFRELEILTPPTPERGRSFLPGMEIYPSLFGFVAERSWGDFAVVQLFNACGTEGDVRLSAPDLDRLGKCHLWSFRDGEYLGIGSSEYVEKNLPAWGSRLIRLTPVKERPALVGCDLHISMGAAEIKAFSVGINTLTIELHDAGARRGSLWIHSQQALQIESVQGCDAEMLQSENNLWKLGVSNRQRDVNQRIVMAVDRPIQTQHTREQRDFNELSKLRVRLDLLENPCIGEPTAPGSLKVSLTHNGVAEICGDLDVISDAAGSLDFVPANVPFRLLPGASMSCEISLLPSLYKPAVTVAASIQHSIRAWIPVSMRRAPIRIPSAVAEKMPYWVLPNDPGAARLRMAASNEDFCFEIQVEDSHPRTNHETLWEGSCVEFFFARVGSNEIRQFFCQPDIEKNGVRVFQAKGIRIREICTEITASFTLTENGYQIIAFIPRSVAGVSPSEKEWMLEIQVSRHNKGTLEHVQLFGGPGAFASSQLYAHIIEE